MAESHLHFNKQYLEKEIRTLASQQRLTTGSRPLKPVAPILKEAQTVLTEVYRELSMAAKQKKELSTAGEWVIDNFYVIQEQIVELKEDIPPSYYNKLPHLMDGEFAGFPRIYEMIQKLAALRDNMIDQGNATAAVQAFQEVDPLSLGELWAVPIMIRLALIERLSEKSGQLLAYRNTRSRAAEHIDEVVEESTDEPGFLLRKLAAISEGDSEDIQFLTAMAQRLQHQGLLTDTERNWFDYRFRRWNTTLEEQSRIEAQRTSRLHLSIQNAISSLREVTQSDWSDFVEDNSFVNRILRLDPAGYFQKMDFQTRDRYRKVVERLSGRSPHSEIEVARRTLLLAERGGQQSGSDKQIHIGYYLIGDGYDRLAKDLNYWKPFGERLRQWGENHSVFYFSAVGVLLAVFLTALSLVVDMFQTPPWLAVLALCASFFPALDLSVTVINRLLTLWLPPRLLPRMDTEGPVADEHRTVVVVPTLIGSPGDARRQLEDLEIRSLANSNPSLQFVLLSDFPDAPSEEMEGDGEILEAAREQVRQLNRRHSSRYGDRFHLLHRKRLWNERQGVWMGWERKRGKLEELNELLVRSGAETSFSVIEGDFTESIEQTPVKYVITLDADTQLPPGSALELINTAAHPLNRAEISESGEIVTSGYGIFQPRISILPKSANKTWFARIFSGNVGVDPYTTAVSDVYQDLVGEGVFTGKGLYDVEVFHKVLDGRFPDNTVLSHDLLESTYLRCALLTDIELFDDFPTTYLSWSKRNHRWVRGDWQLLRWLFPKTPGGVRPQPGASRPPFERNPLSGISRWKIFDNLRRSLNPLFLLIFFLLGWTVLPGSPWIWSLAAFGIVAFPIYSSFSAELFNRPVRVSRSLYLEKIWSNLKLNTVQALTTFLILPHQAYLAVDAICRTLWRLAVSKRNRLEWVSASQTEMQRAGYTEYWQKMWVNPGWAAVSLFFGWYFHPAILFLAVPMAIAWGATPALAWILSSRDPAAEKRELNPEQRRELRIWARRTWHFFERFTGEESRWLPPDNVQEKPWLGPVDRTSPTNIGLALACTCSAHEFGYLTAPEFLHRIERMLDAMDELELYGGHLYNWYEISSGDVMYPRYVSVVDSGNLAGSLIYLKQYLQTLPVDDLPVDTWHEGLTEAVWVLRELSDELQGNESRPDGFTRTIHTLLGDLEAVLSPVPDGPEEWAARLDRMAPTAEKLSDLEFDQFRKTLSDFELEELVHWFGSPAERIRQQKAEMLRLSGEEAVREETVAGEILPGEADPGRSVYEADLPQGQEERVQKRRELAERCDAMVTGMDFSILYREDRDLFSIGYNVERASLDKSTYDLLASEARLASFIAIAKGDVPAKHWFRLSRRLTSIQRNEILLSWGGTMFEYLMPLLFMSTYDETLLDNTYENIVLWQQEYGTSRGFPWGFSESAYGVLNLELHYQYRTFGAPGLGLRRGLAEDYVVSPYSSMLALMVRPNAAIENLQRLKSEGAYSMNGFYEAVDYTSYRGEKEDRKQIIRMYMAHHQGMSLLALANVLKGNRVQELFHREPLVQACELLLQERVPRGIPIKEPRPIDVELEPGEEQKAAVTVDHSGIDRLRDPLPRTHFLSNGEYSTMVTNRGTGYSWHNDQALTRWKADRAGDPGGLFFYIKDLDSNSRWSVGHWPVKRDADRYDAWFHAGKVQIARVDEWIESFMEVCVSPEDNIELRKITLTNYSERPRELELTSYAEVVLNDREADRSHPAFSNLFVQTGHVPEHHALVALRRPRSEQEETSWLVHTIASEDLDSLSEPLEYETDRFRFTGRGRSLENPAAMDEGSRLSRTVGNVTDPIVSLRKKITLRPGEKKSVTFGLGKAEDYPEAAAMADHYNNPWATDRVFELASIYGRVELDHIGLSGEDAQYFQQLAGALIYGNRRFRPDEEVLQRNRRTQSGLWAYGISGDYPILLYRISETEQIRNVELLLKAHTLWRLKGLDVDLVIINDHPPSYIDELQETIHQTIRSSFEHRKLNKRGGVFVLRGDSISPEDQVLLQTVAGVVLEGKLKRTDFRPRPAERAETDRQPVSRPLKPSEIGTPDGPADTGLLFHNGYGGFSPDGKEYVIHLDADPETGLPQYPPAPWINVLANPEFGCITSERGSGFTWSRNSRENRLTPWSNDPVSDPAGEALYVRDDEKGRFWSPTPGPVPGSGRYTVRHGFGYTRHTNTVLEIDQEVTEWVAAEDPVRVVRLRLSNRSSHTRRLTVFRYLEWVLGVSREDSARHVVTDRDPTHRAILAWNHYNNEFAGRVAFAAGYHDRQVRDESVTGDREEFLGEGGLSDPQALRTGQRLGGRFGAGHDPCAASGTSFVLEPGETAECHFILGEAESRSSAEKLMQKYRDPATAGRSLEEVHALWEQKLGKIQIDTPAPELNLMVNGWLQYQNIACRMWGRSAFYQSGGAYGFRDQLQDAGALLMIDPKQAREQILLHSSRQFEEGDVQHWWHPPTGRGIRSRITDDLLWLPWITAQYIETTGDRKILDEKRPFITARPLEEGEHEAYLVPETSGVEGTLYEHCCRTIDRSLEAGEHGMPLMGTGDWNDGMNLVGEKGKGESVWLGFFLFDVLTTFIPHCEARDDGERVQRYTDRRRELKKHLNREGWDGEWYRRAWYDDGTPLGSAENDECRIDAIAQAWSVISGAASHDKAEKALESAFRHLVSEPDGIIRLLTPAFDATEKNPGYIKGYIPGVRENGGQYTHGALWLVRAYAEMGYGERATRLIRMLTPVSHSRNKYEADRYKVEPFAVSADIYGEPPLTGMGGWTWYTGSAGWMYRVIVESILGLRITGGDTVHLQPSISPEWDRYSMTLKEQDGVTGYEITVRNEKGLESGRVTGTMDGKQLRESKKSVAFKMKSDGRLHRVELEII